MALDSSQNGVSTQYLKNEWLKYYKFLQTRSRLGLFCVNLRKFIAVLLALDHVISERYFLSNNGPGHRHLCHTDAFLVSSYVVSIFD